MYVKCINNQIKDKRGIIDLSDIITINKIYDTVYHELNDPSHRYIIIDDKGNKHELRKSLFIPLQEHRNNILNDLI